MPLSSQNIALVETATGHKFGNLTAKQIGSHHLDRIIDAAREQGVVYAEHCAAATIDKLEKTVRAGAPRIMILRTELGAVRIPAMGVMLDEANPDDRAALERMMKAFRAFHAGTAEGRPLVMPVMEAPTAWSVDISDEDIATFWPGENPADIRLQLANCLAELDPPKDPVKAEAVAIQRRAEELADGPCSRIQDIRAVALTVARLAALVAK